MAILSLGNSERLFWLGRYSERKFTGIKFLLAQPSWNESCFDEGSSESVHFSLMRAYDNAIVLRDEIGSDTFSYVQLAVYEMKNASRSRTPLVGLQRVNDNIAAFWGMADDSISDEHVRGIIKLGKRVERVDLYARQNAGAEDIRREIHRLAYRIGRTGLHYDGERLSALKALADEESIRRPDVVREVESLVNFS